MLGKLPLDSLVCSTGIPAITRVVAIDIQLGQPKNKLLWEWNRAELNCRPPWVLTYRSFTGLATLTLAAGITLYPG